MLSVSYSVHTLMQGLPPQSSIKDARLISAVRNVNPMRVPLVATPMGALEKFHGNYDKSM